MNLPGVPQVTVLHVSVTVYAPSEQVVEYAVLPGTGVAASWLREPCTKSHTCRLITDRRLESRVQDVKVNANVTRRLLCLSHTYGSSVLRPDVLDSKWGRSLLL